MNEFKIYTIEELKETKPGTVFEHQKFGKCIVVRRKNYKCMIFKKNFGIKGHNVYEAFFLKNDHPWNLPMRKIS